ncbi:MAG: HEAT repeat domain-containing protein [Planctomycetes bacterium]|nr:HEAT repeat domain-containing protein [Planctomycetota bacterium]
MISVLALGAAILAQSQPPAFQPPGSQLPGFDGAQWIWLAPEPGRAALDMPAGLAYFRAALSVPEKAPVQSAEVLITADNLFTLYLNGRFAGESGPDPNAWNRPRRFDVSGWLMPGQNIVAVEAVNTLPGPAGLLARVSARLADGQTVALASGAVWKFSGREEPNWEQPEFNDQGWSAALALGEFGAGPWGSFPLPAEAEPAGARDPDPAIDPPPDYPWPEAVVFIGEDCSLYRPPAPAGNSYDSLSVTIFNPRDSRAYPEHDLPAPMKTGRKLYALSPARPGAPPRLLLDAGRGGLGAPSVSFDGRWIYVSMAPDGEPFFHIYRLAAEGGEPQRFTGGPFHDIDPAELPDGRIVFTSTRIGTFEEYHNPPSRALFVMEADGRGLRPLTHTLIFDNEPEVLADGRILFIRSDNFFDRGKVETQLHAIHPDGTSGYTEFGLDLGPEYGGRLRAFHCGSPAPLPDGRLAFVTASGIAVGLPGSTPREIRHLPVEAGDVAALPDGRLLCTLPRRIPYAQRFRRRQAADREVSYEKIAIVDPQDKEAKAAILFDSPGAPLHSPVHLGPRTRPPLLPERVDPSLAEDGRATGVLFCQNARLTKNTTAGWAHVRAIRVLMGKGLTTRSSHSYIVHAGSEVTELGTVPLAPDGSFAVEVPADAAIAFQAVDAEGRSELNEMSWIYVRPGETRGCVGCHAPRQAAPRSGTEGIQALRARPAKLLGRGEPHRFRGNNAAVTGLMELQFDRYREVAGIDRHAAAAGALATGAPEVEVLIGELRGGAPDRQIAAAGRLAIFRDRAAAPALEKALRGRSRELRVAAAMALAACGSRGSIPPLLEALGDADPLAAQAAAVALENLTGGAESFDAFAGSEARRRQAETWRRWLQVNPWEKIERDLIERLASADRDAVRRAAVTLGHVGAAAARSALRELLLRARDDNPFPEWRKTHRGDEARFNSLAAVNPRTLQAVARSIGYLRDRDAVPLLAETLRRHSDPETANLFLAEAAAEALGRIGGPEAEAALLGAFAALKDYPAFTAWYGDHDALIACHASPVHYFIVEGLDALGSAQAGGLAPHLIRSVPTDPDRALLLANDDYETLAGRVLRRAGVEEAVVETGLAILGDPDAVRTPDLEQALAATHPAWGGKPDPENRAAQILSLACRERKYEPRLRAAFERYRAKGTDIPRLFDTGIPVVTKLPAKHWVCFYLARALGNLADPRSVDVLIAALEQSPPEAAPGRPDPLGPGVHFLHNDLTPCWRAAAAWALGRLGDRRAVPALLKVLGDLDNALDTRHAAAIALGRLAGPAHQDELRRLAAGCPEVSVRRVLLEACRRLEPAKPALGRRE